MGYRLWNLLRLKSGKLIEMLCLYVKYRISMTEQGQTMFDNIKQQISVQLVVSQKSIDNSDVSYSLNAIEKSDSNNQKYGSNNNNVNTLDFNEFNTLCCEQNFGFKINEHEIKEMYKIMCNDINDQTVWFSFFLSWFFVLFFYFFFVFLFDFDICDC